MRTEKSISCVELLCYVCFQVCSIFVGCCLLIMSDVYWYLGCYVMCCCSSVLLLGLSPFFKSTPPTLWISFCSDCCDALAALANPINYIPSTMAETEVTRSATERPDVNMTQAEMTRSASEQPDVTGPAGPSWAQLVQLV